MLELEVLGSMLDQLSRGQQLLQLDLRAMPVAVAPASGGASANGG